MYIVMCKAYENFLRYDPYRKRSGPDNELKHSYILMNRNIDKLVEEIEEYCSEWEYYKDKDHFLKVELSQIYKITDVIEGPTTSDFFASLVSAEEAKQAAKAKQKSIEEKLLAERAKAKEKLLYLRLKKKYGDVEDQNLG